MSIQKLTLETIQKIRLHIQSALVLPSLEVDQNPYSSSEIDELPEPSSLSDLGNLFSFGGALEPESDGTHPKSKWFISSSNPGIALMKFPGIRLKSDVRLVTYLFRATETGVGATWAIPEALSTTAQLEKFLNVNADEQHPPRPEYAFEDVMDAIEGDRSPISFMIASIFFRELREFGATGKSCNWSHHRLINELPPKVTWQWRTNQPIKDLSPKVAIYPDNRAGTEFFTCRVTPPVGIFQHVDQYPPTQYKPTSVSRVVAIPQRG